MHNYTQSQMLAAHVSRCRFAHAHMKQFFTYLSLFIYCFLFLYASLHLVFIFLHLLETAYEILITMHYQDDVLSLLRSSTCVCIGVFLGASVLPANDHCFRDLLPSFSLLLSICLFSARLTSNLVPRPPVSPTTPSLSPPPLPPKPRCRFKQLALSSADTLSMQIESPPTRRLSLISLPSLFFHSLSEIMW